MVLLAKKSLTLEYSDPVVPTPIPRSLNDARQGLVPRPDTPSPFLNNRKITSKYKNVAHKAFWGFPL